MRYYEVAVEKLAVKGQTTLTYAWSEALQSGDAVRVPLGRSQANGVVAAETTKPEYQTKELVAVLKERAVPVQLIEAARWLSQYYATELPFVIQQLLPAGLHKNRRLTSEKAAANIPRAHRHASDQPLTPDQAEALNTLEKHRADTVLLHGVTGSGKTRIYIERARDTVADGKGVIVLVPEIGLTAQLVGDFQNVFDDVFVVHSQLTEATRHRLWEDIGDHPNPVVIGARSALFAPVHELGLIVVDEEHESAYKQDQNPKYHAVRLAGWLAHAHKAQLILGSATPRVEDYYLAEAKKAPIIRITNPIKEEFSLTSEVIDLKKRELFGQRSRLFSLPLISGIESALAGNRQVLLFHNRRGTATMVICTHCGWVAECPNCFLPLTFHRDLGKLICHVCDHRTTAPHACPACGEPALLYKGIGTKQIVDEAAKLFPAARIARFDSDTHKDEHLSVRYEEVYQGQVDILVGTQMIAKGLDLPQLGLVGVVLADTALYLPDYSANERAFQLLYQVIGRAGRHQDGHVVIQSYTPEHPAIRAAIDRQYEEFYENEIEDRRLGHYPPFSFLMVLSVERAKRETALGAADELRDKLARQYRGLKVLGPSPAFHEHTKQGYRWQLVIKANKRELLTGIVHNDLPDRWQFELDPINLL